MMKLVVERGIEKALDPTQLEVAPASLKMIKTPTFHHGWVHGENNGNFIILFKRGAIWPS